VNPIARYHRTVARMSTTDSIGESLVTSMA
jgi:hypothetical protein